MKKFSNYQFIHSGRLIILLVFCMAIVGCRRSEIIEGTQTPTREPTSTPIPWEPTPTRTRPARSFYIRPTLAETPILVDEVSATSEFIEEPFTLTATLPFTTTETPRPTDTVVQTAIFTPSATTIAPTPVRELVSEPSLLDFAMFDTNNGWGLTEDMVLRTTIRGATWVNTTPIGFDTPVDAVPYGYFSDANHAWVLITRINDVSGTIFNTENGGNTWQSDPVPFTNAKFYFLENQYGWALVDRSNTANSQAIDLYTTVDNGRTWSLIHQVTPVQVSQPGSLPYNGFKNGVTFVTAFKGWITGESLAGGRSWLYTSVDGGRSWYEQVLSLPTGSQTNTVITEPPFFYNTQQGLMPVRLNQISELTVLYETTDGGDTWSFTTPVPVGGPIDCVSPTTCRVWNGRVLAATENAGRTWRQTTTNINIQNTYFQIDFIDPLVGFALSLENIGVSTRSTFYLTTDGGSNWTAVW